MTKEMDEKEDKYRLPNALMDEMEKMKADMKLLRRLLWLNHGCIGLYGDDGEMQCGQCLIDFKRDDPQLIERKLMLRHGKFIQTEHGEIFVPNDILREKEGKDDLRNLL
jgi:hypothetical protein